MHVLVVEDDARLRQVLGRLLRTTGFDRFTEAGDGVEALAALGRGRFDLVLTDYHMPNLDGIEFVRQARQRGDQTPVIMISGQDDRGVVVRAIKAGVNNYLPKPINADVLFEKIGQTLGLQLAAG